MTDDEMKRIKARRALAAREHSLDSIAIPGLPLDADPPQLRRAVPQAEAILSKAESELLDELRPKNPFFDAIVESWGEIGKGIPARPGRADENGRIFLYVKTSAQNYAVRKMLPKLRAKLKVLPQAPSRISLHIEIRG